MAIQLRTLFALFAAVLISSGNLLGQTEAGAPATVAYGSIAGLVIDQDTGAALRDVAVGVVERPDLFTRTDIDGRYRFDQIAPGTYTVRFFKAGYQPVDITQVQVVANEVAAINGTLTVRVETAETPSGPVESGEDLIVFETLRVTSDEASDQNVELINLRRQALTLNSSLSREDFSNLAVGDAAEAVLKLPGISVTEGRYAVVRGLRDRYVVTRLNGVPLASPDPDREAVQLDLFPAGLIQSVTAVKSYSPNLPGNAGGGAIDIETLVFPLERILEFSFGLGFSENTTTNEDFPSNPADYWQDVWADGKTQRDLPQGAGFHVYPESSEPGPDYDFSFTYGDTWNFPHDRRLGFVAAFDWARSYAYKEEQFTRLESVGQIPKFLSSIGYFQTGEEEVTLSGLVGLTFDLNRDHRFRYDIFYTRYGLDTASRAFQVTQGLVSEDYSYGGVSGNPLDIPGAVGSPQADNIAYGGGLTYEQRSFISHQVGGSHFLEAINDSSLKWNAALSHNAQSEPLSRQFFAGLRYSIPGSEQTFFGANTSDAGRGDSRISISERQTEQDNRYLDLSLDTPLPWWGGRSAKLIAGASWDNAERLYSSFGEPLVGGYLLGEPVFNLTDLRSPAPVRRTGWVEEFENRNLLGPNAVIIQNEYRMPLSGEGDGERTIQAGFLQAELPLLSDLRLIGGARVEDTELVYNGRGAIPSLLYGPTFTPRPIEQTDVLPAVSLIYEPLADLRLQLAFSQTLARPSFREIQPFAVYELLRNEIIIGNPGPVSRGSVQILDGLEIGTVDSYDFRVEYYFGDADLIAVTPFYKEVSGYIERRVVDVTAGGSPQPVFSYENNPNKGKVLGVEIEARFSLSRLRDWWDFTRFPSRFSVGGNATLIDASIDRNPGSVTVTQLFGAANVDGFYTEDHPLYEQPSFIYNLFLSYTHEELGTDITLSYYAISERLNTVGIGGIPDRYDDDYGTFNLVWTQKLPDLSENLSIKFAVKNIFEPLVRQFYDDNGASLNSPSSVFLVPEVLPSFAAAGLQAPSDFGFYSSYRQNREYSVSVTYAF